MLGGGLEAWGHQSPPVTPAAVLEQVNLRSEVQPASGARLGLFQTCHPPCLFYTCERFLTHHQEESWWGHPAWALGTLLVEAQVFEGLLHSAAFAASWAKQLLAVFTSALSAEKGFRELYGIRHNFNFSGGIAVSLLVASSKADRAPSPYTRPLLLSFASPCSLSSFRSSEHAEQEVERKFPP